MTPSPPPNAATISKASTGNISALLFILIDSCPFVEPADWPDVAIQCWFNL